MTHTAPTPWTKGDDGGSAFPASYEIGPPSAGMSLRDYFAATAVNGMLASLTETSEYPAGKYLDALVSKGFEVADAMLAARTARGETP